LSIFFRTPTPIDETRYLTVAWEMWLRQDFLVPYLNGATYSHKPPLLFWLINLSWGMFGVSEWADALDAYSHHESHKKHKP
jgi:4-amino-4-deoxy-L-arabinose transferase-like glycosyltransferase